MGVKITSAIIFLGTGGDSYVVGKQIRASGGIIFQINENQFHLDPGPGSLVMANQCEVNLRENTAVLVSHNHLNHCNDINAVIDAMTYSGLDKKGVLVANKTAINGSQHYRPFLQDFYKNCLERYIALEAGQRVGINDVEIKAIRAKHSEPNAIGFKFFTPEFTLSYSADTMYSVEVIPEYENSNILVLNVPYLGKEEGRDNLCKEDAINIIRKVRPRLAILTHFGAKFLRADPLYEAREIQKEAGVQVIAAKDGMVVNPLSYSAEKGQRTLTGLRERKDVEVVGASTDISFKEVDEIVERQTSLPSEEPEQENK